MFRSLTTRLFTLVMLVSVVPLVVFSVAIFTLGYSYLEKESLIVLSHVVAHEARDIQLAQSSLSGAVQEFREEIDLHRILSETEKARRNAEPQPHSQSLSIYASLHQRLIAGISVYSADGTCLAAGGLAGSDFRPTFLPVQPPAMPSGVSLKLYRSPGGQILWATEIHAAHDFQDYGPLSIYLFSSLTVGELWSGDEYETVKAGFSVVQPIFRQSRRYILNHAGDVITVCTGDQWLAPDETDSPKQERIIAEHLRAGSTFQGSFRTANGHLIYGYLQYVPHSELAIMAVVDSEILDTGLRTLALASLATAAVLILLSVLASYILSRRVTKPLRDLIAVSGTMARGEYPVGKLSVPAGGGEISQLNSAFNEMIESLRISQSALRDSETKFLALAEQPLLGIMFVADAQILYANAALTGIFGRSFSAGDNGLDTLLSLIAEEDRAFVYSRDGETVTFSENCWFRTRNEDGRERSIHLLTRPVRLAETPACLLMFVDISEQKRYEGELREQKAYLENLLEAIADPFYVIDAETREVVMANRSARELQKSRKVDTCFALNRNSTPCSLKNHLCPFELSKLTKLSSTVEQIHLDEEGRKRYIEVHGHPVLDKDERVVQVIEYQIDITSRKLAEIALRESEQRYSSLFENNHSIMLIVDPSNGMIIDANPAACRFYGYLHEQITSLSLGDISTTPHSAIETQLANVMDTSKNHFFAEHRLAGGEIRNVETFVGRIRISGKDLIYSIVHDITERAYAERELKRRFETETLSASLATRFINIAADEINRRIVDALQEIGEFAGVDRCIMATIEPESERFDETYQWSRDDLPQGPQELKDQELSRFAWIGERLRHLEPVVVNDTADLPVEAEAEIKILEASGTRSMLVVPLISAGSLMGAIALQAVTAARGWTSSDILLLRVAGELFVNVLVRRRFETELGKSRDRLKDLSAHIQDRIENERAGIAREVHDELGQLLTALKFDIFWLKNKVSAENGVLVEKSRSMGEIIDEAVRCVQRITAELRPVLLDDLGLAAAVDWLVRDFGERTGIICNMELDEVLVEGQAAITLFRITQEALTNIGRHSFATEVNISLKGAPDGMHLTISDNGVGINEAQLNDPKSYGLMGIQERAGFLDGSASIRGAKGEGTEIDVFIPLDSKRRTL